MTKAELTEWFSDTFWQTYLLLVKTPFPTKFKQGNRGQALQKILSMNPSADLRERIQASLLAQIRNRKKLYSQCGSMQKYIERTEYQKLYANRHCSTWLNQMGYEDEIPTIEQVELETPGVALTCQNKDCNEERMGPTVPWCQRCYPDTLCWTPLLRKQFKKMGLVKNEGETTEQWNSRIKQEGIKAIRNRLKR